MDISFDGRIGYQPDGSFKQTYCVFQDITERKKAEADLWEKAFMLESTSVIIGTSDLDGNMTYANPAFLRAWGFDSLDEVLGRPFPEFWEVGEKRDEIMGQLLGNGSGRWSGELKASSKDGSQFDLWVFAVTVYDKQGEPIALMSTSLDIKERKQAEKKLAKYRGRLEELVKERTKELENKNKELDSAVKVFVGREKTIKKLQERIRLLGGSA